MITRGLVCCCLLAVLGGCNRFNGFGFGTLAAAGGARIAGTGSLFAPRFPGSGGLFLSIEGRDAAANMAIFSGAATLSEATLESVPSEADLGFADDDSMGATITGNGLLMAFLSRATNLLPDDSDVFPVADRWHAYVRDLQTGINELVSHDPETGAQANADTTAAAISANGRFVAFATAATNIHPRATNGLSHVYVYDRLASMLQLISHEAGGLAANGDSFAPAISPDGRFVGFESLATDLLPGDTNGERDIYLYDRSLRMFERISFDLLGGEALIDPREVSLSANGLFVAFTAEIAAGDPRQVLVRDRAAAMTELTSKDDGGFPGDAESRAPAISPNGLTVAFETDATNFSVVDTGATADIYVHDRPSGATTLLTIGLEGEESDGDSASPSIGSDNTSVAFSTFATNLFMIDPASGDTETGSADILILSVPPLP